MEGAVYDRVYLLLRYPWLAARSGSVHPYAIQVMCDEAVRPVGHDFRADRGLSAIFLFCDSATAINTILERRTSLCGVEQPLDHARSCSIS